MSSKDKASENGVGIFLLFLLIALVNFIYLDCEQSLGSLPIGTTMSQIGMDAGN